MASFQFLIDRMARVIRGDLAGLRTVDAPPGRTVPAARGRGGPPPAPIAAPLVGTSLDPAAPPDCFGPVPHHASSPLPRLDRHGRVIPGTGIRMFVDALPLPGPAGRNELGNHLPVAVPDTVTYPGCDYYEIGLTEYRQRLHRDLPATRLRGYQQLNMGTDAYGHNTVAPPGRPYHCGPLIRAHRGRPVRIKFINRLPTGRAGDLFLPVDTTVRGAGAGPLDGGPYPQNRAVFHLHGALTGWTSAGNPLQWVTPAGEITPYPQGPALAAVPDMPPPGPGAVTLFFPNHQGSRLLWFHDNTLGISRLTVSSGQLGLYLLDDPVEQQLVDDGVVPAEEIPLVVEDRTFVPDDAQLASQDPTWDRERWGGLGSVWFPHVYQPRQNPHHPSGRNPTGRYDYGPWTAVPTPPPQHPPVENPHHDPVARPWAPPRTPDVPHPSIVPEVYGDTPVVNGCAYPYVQVRPAAYRLRILNACLDRCLNLQLYRAAADGPMWQVDGTLRDAAAGQVPMVPAVPDPARPVGWPTDGRQGGVPDPAARGPELIQIGTDGGLLPVPVVLPNQPVDYDYDRRDATVLNVSRHTLLLAPGERADVIVDFSSVPPGGNVILYNDAPAPLPAFDPRHDHHGGAADRTASGGLPPSQPGYGPNTRTLAQFRVAGTPAQPYDLARLAERLPRAYAASQPAPVVPQDGYRSAFGASIGGQVTVPAGADEVVLASASLPVLLRHVGPVFESGHGRATTRYGVDLPATGPLDPQVVRLGPADPPTEVLLPPATGGDPLDGVQVWRLRNDGGRTEVVHFGAGDVQVVNRVDRDGALRLPDGNELGWKGSVRVDPRQDVIVALRPTVPPLPYKLGGSVRLPDPTRPDGDSSPFTPVDPATGRPTRIENRPVDLGWEYRWYGPPGQQDGGAERPLVLRVAPAAPTGLTAVPVPGSATALPAIVLTWTGQSGRPVATVHLLRRATDAAFTCGVTDLVVAATATRHVDDTVVPGIVYHYRVRAENTAGFSDWSHPVRSSAELPAPTGLSATVPPASPPRVVLRWTNRSFATGVEVQRATNPTFTSGGVTTTVLVTDQHLDPTVGTDTRYYYRVRTTYLGATSPWSNVTSVATPGVPAPPGELVATTRCPGPDIATVSLSWQAEPAGPGGGFIVQRAADTRFTHDLLVFTVHGRAFTNTGLARGTRYHYRIQAFNVAGASPFTAPLVVTTPA